MSLLLTPQKNDEKYIRRLFVAGLVLKGINSVIEILGGILLLFTGSITTFISVLINKELTEDPTSFVAIHTQGILPYLHAYGQLYFSVYLLIHGVLKVILVICLLRNKLWAYPATISVLSIFVIYQLYKIVFGYSLFLVLLTALDAILIVLTWHEYQIVSKQKSHTM